jgi:tetratricopeptide (TPR) repeat protein
MRSGRATIVAAALAAVAALPVVLHAQRPSDPPAGIAVRVARADAAYSAGDRQDAEREYAAIVALDSSRSHAIFRLAQLRADRDRGAAVALYRRYVVLEPRDAWGYIALADALGASGDMAAAMAAYDKAARLEPAERDVRVGRARLLARRGYTDAAIVEYERWVARTPQDAEAWGELATQRRRAGRYPEAAAALQRAETKDADANRAVTRDLGRVRALGRATIEPLIGGGLDADGLTTMRAGVTATSPALGRGRAFISASSDRAGDGTFARGSQKTAIGVQYRPLAQLQLELVGGVARADRTLVDTAATPTTPTPPSGPGSGRRPPIGRPVAPGASSFESFPVGRARLTWRTPGDAIGVDARMTRQLLDASPFLVAQGALRDEGSLALDLRVAGPIRVRGFGRVGTVHNEDESNGRRILGGALAYAPGAYEVTLRAQSMAYDAPTALAYFAPRRVRTAEVTTYLERETAEGTTVALDLGAGAQQVSDWTTSRGTWSPAFRGWTQVVRPLGGRFALGTEIEAYDARIGMDAPSVTLPTTQWWYGSVALWLKATF